jgi:hypothetical protein
MAGSLRDSHHRMGVYSVVQTSSHDQIPWSWTGNYDGGHMADLVLSFTGLSHPVQSNASRNQNEGIRKTLEIVF